jgi:hypothetical protein
MDADTIRRVGMDGVMCEFSTRPLEDESQGLTVAGLVGPTPADGRPGQRHPVRAAVPIAQRRLPNRPEASFVENSHMTPSDSTHVLLRAGFSKHARLRRRAFRS